LTIALLFAIVLFFLPLDGFCLALEKKKIGKFVEFLDALMHIKHKFSCGVIDL
jgi:hypothetical protein